MRTTYTHFSDLAKVTPTTDQGILSRTLFNDDRLKVVLFGFAQGEELSEHTASMPAVLPFSRARPAGRSPATRLMPGPAPGSTRPRACAAVSVNNR